MAKRKALGKGLTALLQDSKTDVTGKNPVPVNSTAEIPVNQIEGNPFQPREEFDEVALEELVSSIRIHGVIQPITVRKVGYEKYEIISGERRVRAAIRVGLETIPAFVRVANDQEMVEMALIENIHRENLNSIEIALSYQRLVEECSLRQDEVADRVGKKRTTVTNYLRLLRLPEAIQIAIRDKVISMGHARAIINVEDPELQKEIFEQIIKKELSVRKTEELVKEKLNSQQEKSKTEKKAPKEPLYEDFQKKMKEFWSSGVKVKARQKGKGEVVMKFKSEKELEKIMELLSKDD